MRTSLKGGVLAVGEASVEILSERLRGLMAEQLGVEPSEMKPDANILEDLGADSLDVVEMVMAIEEAFDIEIDDEDAEAMRTVADVEAYVAKRLV
jgi:acyl carrier protein